MKVIDLLNRIANGEAVPKKIRIPGWCYNFEWIEYKDNYYDKSEDIDLMSALSMCSDELNREVEIIEENKKIEKIIINSDNNGEEYILGDHCEKLSYAFSDLFLARKINNILDEINKMKKD